MATAAASNVEMKNEEEEKEDGPSDHERTMRHMLEKFGGIIKADK